MLNPKILHRADPHSHQPSGLDAADLPPEMHIARLVPVSGPFRPNILEMLIALETRPETGDLIALPASHNNDAIVIEVSYVEDAELYAGNEHSAFSSGSKFPVTNVHVRTPA